MKRSSIFMLVVMMVFMTSACGKDSNSTRVKEKGSSSWEAGKQSADQTEQNGAKKILVAYFSWAENATQDDIDAMTSPSVTEPGNVAQLASWVSGETGGDLFSIQVKEPYPADWDGCLERANQEKKDNTHPALRNTVENIEEFIWVHLI